jgi:hypothetical protein
LFLAVVFAVVRDALSHAGPADLARIDRSVCLRLVAPGIDPVRALTYEIIWYRDLAIRGSTSRTANRQPLPGPFLNAVPQRSPGRDGPRRRDPGHEQRSVRPDETAGLVADAMLLADRDRPDPVSIGLGPFSD